MWPFEKVGYITVLGKGGGGSHSEVAAGGGAEVDAHVVRTLTRSHMKHVARHTSHVTRHTQTLIVIVRVTFTGARVARERHACLRALLQRIPVHVQIARLCERRAGQDNNKGDSKLHAAPRGRRHGVSMAGGWLK
jgi:hypothetical protein